MTVGRWLRYGYEFLAGFYEFFSPQDLRSTARNNSQIFASFSHGSPSPPPSSRAPHNTGRSYSCGRRGVVPSHLATTIQLSGLPPSAFPYIIA